MKNLQRLLLHLLRPQLSKAQHPTPYTLSKRNMLEWMMHAPLGLLFFFFVIHFLLVFSRKQTYRYMLYHKSKQKNEHLRKKKEKETNNTPLSPFWLGALMRIMFFDIWGVRSRNAQMIQRWWCGWGAGTVEGYRDMTVVSSKWSNKNRLLPFISYPYIYLSQSADQTVNCLQ